MSVTSSAAFFNQKAKVTISVTLNGECFKPDMSLEMPRLRSNTADYLNGQSTISVVDSFNWGTFRNNPYTIKDRLGWISALRELNTFKQMGFPDEGKEGYLKSYDINKGRYFQKLEEMKKKFGIWNCMEYAHFALLDIEGKIKPGYTGHIASLNDPQIPDSYSKYYQIFTANEIDQKKLRQLDANHDHAFVVITNDNNPHEPLFIIDLWQGLITGKDAFVGTSKQFISALNNQPPNPYVKGRVTEAHIFIQTLGNREAACDGAKIIGFLNAKKATKSQDDACDGARALKLGLEGTSSSVGFGKKVGFGNE